MIRKIDIIKFKYIKLFDVSYNIIYYLLYLKRIILRLWYLLRNYINSSFLFSLYVVCLWLKVVQGIIVWKYMAVTVGHWLIPSFFIQ